MHELLKRYFGKLSDKLVSDKTSLNRRLKQDEVTMDLKVGRVDFTRVFSLELIVALVGGAAARAR
jgi:hypothetical protein